MFLDESGTPDFDPAAGSTYFAFGSATYSTDRPIPLQAFHDLRTGTRSALLNGFHAVDDSLTTRAEMFELIAQHPARFGATFMLKANAHDHVRQREKIWMYKYTLYRHLASILLELRGRYDTIHVVAAEIGMQAKRSAVRLAVEDVCQQLEKGADIRPHIWRSSTSAGLQIADYGLWAIQRHVIRGESWQYEKAVAPTMRSLLYPWGAKA
ncbi:DUF3800 domain-containing protein [Leucobacter viscericola]|uniref:DUF3800 domain-containing protein n=1 Tax=Leucobacter viscericola TaxID=2714935 RepID=A0A6G7XFV6_9MICO|nr:DUF3800 domain-containing protein [Leucobacter viscericola]QIK63433.1 DUF3800 domain-containing protein [Leucobacter viscericola]